MSEETQPESNSPAPAKGLPLRRRRGHRGGRGRSRAPRPPVKGGAAETAAVAETSTPVESALPVESTAPPIQPPVEAPIRLSEHPVRPLPSRPLPPRPRPEPVVHAPQVPRTDGSAISQAVNEVMLIVESLRDTLEHMEEVLELVELAERQKLTDEREIESLLRALRQFQLQDAKCEGTAGGDKPSHVVTKARSGAAEPNRKQLRQINRKASKQGELAEAHDRHEHKNVPGLAQKFERHNRGDERANKCRRKNRFASMVVREFGECEHAKECAGVLHDHVDAGPHQSFAGKFCWWDVLCLQNFGYNIADEFRTEESHTPKSNHTCDA